MRTIKGGGSFTRNNIADLNANFAEVGQPFTPNGRVIYCNPASANTLLPQDGSQAQPYTAFATAVSALRSSLNDILILVGDGTTSATARIDTAFTWSLTGVQFLGYCSPSIFSPRSRMAPTSSTTAFSPFFTVSGQANLFADLGWFHGFTTGTATEICLTLSSASRNVFQRCHIAGMGDTDGTSGTGTGSRSLKISGGGENLFEDCVIGLDTEPRTVANASIELAGGTNRNIFRRCILPFYATGAGVLGILGTGNACVDRMNLFEDCTFVNSVKSGSGTSMTALGSFTTASPGGLIVFKNCMTVGITKFGDTNFLANSYIDMPAVSASAGGLGVNPS